MKNKIKAAALIMVTLTVSACSIDSSLFGVKLPELLSTKTQSAEIVSGSSQYVNTTNYKVSATVGSVYSDVKTETVSGNYKVYLTVQGQMISEDEIGL